MVSDDEVRATPLLAVARTIVAVASLVVPAEQRDEWTREWNAELWYLHDSLVRDDRLTIAEHARFLLRASGSLVDAVQLSTGDMQAWRESFVEVGARWWRRSPVVATALLFLSLGIAADAMLIAFARALVEYPSATWAGLAPSTRGLTIGVAALVGVSLLVASVVVTAQLLGGVGATTEHRTRERRAELLLAAVITAWVAHAVATYGAIAIPNETPEWQAPPDLNAMLTHAWLATWLCALLLLAVLRRHRRGAGAM